MKPTLRCAGCRTTYPTNRVLDVPEDERRKLPPERIWKHRCQPGIYGALQLVYDVAGLPADICKGCNQRVYWVTTEADKTMPCNEDGTSHFINCPESRAFRKG